MMSNLGHPSHLLVIPRHRFLHPSPYLQVTSYVHAPYYNVILLKYMELDVLFLATN